MPKSSGGLSEAPSDMAAPNSSSFDLFLKPIILGFALTICINSSGELLLARPSFIYIIGCCYDAIIIGCYIGIPGAIIGCYIGIPYIGGYICIPGAIIGCCIGMPCIGGCIGIPVGIGGCIGCYIAMPVGIIGCYIGMPVYICICI